MEHTEPDLIFRVSPSVRVLLGTLIPAFLVIMGVAIFAVGGSPWFTLGYFAIALMMWLAVGRVSLSVSTDGVTRTIVRKRFVPWRDVDDVVLGADRRDGLAALRLRDGADVVLRPLQAERGSAEYIAAARIVHATHIAYKQREAFGMAEPLKMQDDVRHDTHA